ncbi:hypothetical protein GCM10017673_38050 [Streptosporangium violaceochromogenes]|nr:hypothetical protein GCM10017673_38050 [Streptosporangium violaceochromogenes]
MGGGRRQGVVDRVLKDEALLRAQGPGQADPDRDVLRGCHCHLRISWGGLGRREEAPPEGESPPVCPLAGLPHAGTFVRGGAAPAGVRLHPPWQPGVRCGAAAGFGYFGGGAAAWAARSCSTSARRAAASALSTLRPAL